MKLICIKKTQLCRSPKLSCPTLFQVYRRYFKSEMLLEIIIVFIINSFSRHKYLNFCSNKKPDSDPLQAFYQHDLSGVVLYIRNKSAAR